MDAFNVVDILKVGLSGLVFLLAYMAYRLLSRLQTKDLDRSSSDQALKIMRSYLWLSIALVLIVGGFSIIELVIKKNDPRDVLQGCRDSLERLDTYARDPDIELIELKRVIISHSELCNESMRKLKVN